MNEKELLRKLGEETIYTAKGHFKSVDIRKSATKYTILACMILSLLGVIGVHEVADKWISATGVLLTFLLFYWDAEEGKDYRLRHKQVGEQYLALHKQIRTCYFLNECSSNRVNELSEQVIQLDQTNKPDISSIARKSAKNAILKNDETDNWFTLPQNFQQ